MFIGLLFALITIFCFGSWAVPTHKIVAPIGCKTFWLTFGHFLLNLIVFIFTGSSISLGDSIIPFIAGMIWGTGVIFSFIAIESIGIVRGIGIICVSIVLISATWGLFYFDEYSKFSSTDLMNCIGSMSLVVLAAFFIILSKEDVIKPKHLTRGVLAAITLGVCHGSYFIPLHSSQLSIFAMFLPLSLGMLAVSLPYALVKDGVINKGFKNNFKMSLAGGLLAIGNYSALIMLDYLGVSFGYPLTQFGIVVNTLWGIFYFKELQSRKSLLFAACGVAIFLIAVIFLGIVRGKV